MHGLTLLSLFSFFSCPHMHAQTHYFSKRVNWIGAITNIQLQKYIIIICLFRVMPLQFSLYLRWGILYVLHAFGSTYRYFGMDKMLLTHLFSPLTYVWGDTVISFLPFFPHPMMPSSSPASRVRCCRPASSAADTLPLGLALV